MVRLGVRVMAEALATVFIHVKTCVHVSHQCYGEVIFLIKHTTRWVVGFMGFRFRFLSFHESHTMRLIDVGI